MTGRCGTHRKRRRSDGGTPVAHTMLFPKPLELSWQRRIMASKAEERVLTDHDEIRNWAEARGAKPACVKGTEGEDDSRLLRLDFPGYSGEGSLQHISWDRWFRVFDMRNLALIVEDRTADGRPSNFNKLVSRQTVEET
jgi:hypothetical protein